MRLLFDIAIWLLNNSLSLLAILISVISLRITVRNRRHDIAVEGLKLKAEVLITMYDAQFRLKEAQDKILSGPHLFPECREGKQKMLSATTIPLIEKSKLIYEGIKEISLPPHPSQMHTLSIHVNEMRKMMASMEVGLNTVVEKCATCMKQNHKPCIEVVSS